MSQDDRTIDASSRRVTGSKVGTSPREQAPNLLDEMARLTEECETLRQAAESQATDMNNLSHHKDDLVAIVSHDIKTPLTAILGYAQHAARLVSAPSPDLEKVEHMLMVIQHHGVFITALLDDLIDASRIELGALEVRAVPCDIRVNLTSVLSLLTPDEAERVDVTVPPMMVVGRGDPRRVEQVLANLIGNALKYSPAASRVTVTVTRHDAGIEVAVGDHGIGIASDHLQQVFDRFHRTPQARASGRSGTGLGLYICRCIVHAHGGRIWAESPGEQLGSTFRFTLPDHPPPELASFPGPE
ncbi:MAG: hypothetical protein NVS2B16_19530 [Chloroflexota bacterium]